jgi:hypothetical protein
MQVFGGVVSCGLVCSAADAHGGSRPDPDLRKLVEPASADAAAAHPDCSSDSAMANHGTLRCTSHCRDRSIVVEPVRDDIGAVPEPSLSSGSRSPPSARGLGNVVALAATSSGCTPSHRMARVPVRFTRTLPRPPPTCHEQAEKRVADRSRPSDGVGPRRKTGTPESGMLGSVFYVARSAPVVVARLMPMG